MKKSVLLIALVMLISFGSLFAKTVSVEDAKTIAVNFFKVTANNARVRGGVNASLNYTRTETDNTVDYYVFDITPGPGFVIVSANDIIAPVIGYSTESNFKSDLNKTGVVDWMKHAAQHIYKGIQQNLPATARTGSLWAAYRLGQKPNDEKSSVVAPLIYTAWNQEPFYNQLCPVNNSTTPASQTVTGCVATTMAQIMKYWSYPTQGTGSFSYNDSRSQGYSNNYGTQSANFGATSYDWNAMPISINSNNTAIATLMYQCGVSVGMDYGTDAQNGSGAQVIKGWGNSPSAENAYTTYFSYNPATIQGVYEGSYNAADWLNLIETDLNAGRPVQYIGEDQSAGGHTWVCDGYDGNGLLHMNWGWGGSSNGYYAVNNLAAGGYNFNSQEAALIGIEPLYPSTVVGAKHISLCAGDTTVLSAQIRNHASYSWTPSYGLNCASCAYVIATPNTTTVYVGKTDSAGVIDTTIVVISVYSKVTASATTTELTCYGAANGVINIASTGGIPTYTYAWSNGLSTASANTLSAGNYTITVTDAVGCSAQVRETLTQPAQINATTSTTGAGCTTATGTANVVASGGAGGLTYEWSNGSTATSLTALAAGTYKVTVTDSRNCTTVVDAAVAQPYQIQFNTSTSNTIHGQYSGTATVENVSGGTDPYTYVWSDGETSQTITGLEAGIYTCTITDHSGCYEVASDTVNITYPTGISNISDAFAFSIYPNPAHAQVLVQLTKFNSNTSLKLENVLGQTILTQTLTSTETQLDLSNYNDGVYFIEIKQGDKRLVKQLVLTK